MGDSNSRPNILFLFADQHAPGILSCAGHPVVDTPNLDRLAAEGTRFENAYCPTPLCVPSRVAHLTGRYGHNTGVLRNEGRTAHGDPTIGTVLREAGYHTGIIGKTQMAQGPEPGTVACDHALDALGFDEAQAHHGKVFAALGEHSDSYQRHLKANGLFEDFFQDYVRRRDDTDGGTANWFTAPSTLPAEEYHEAYIGRQTSDWVRQYSRDQPFFMWCNWVGPHVPWDAPEEYVERYDLEEIPPPVEDPLTNAPEPIKQQQQELADEMPPGAWREPRAHYYGMVEAIDDAIGRILDALEEQQILDETIVVYASDHGEMLYDHGLQGKFLMYEQSVGVPLIVRYPDDIQRGQQVETPVSTIDLFPTLVEYAQATAPVVHHGTSLRPALQGEGTERGPVFAEMGTTKMVRRGDWKYVYNPDWDVQQLFNLRTDPEELNNRSGESELVEREQSLREAILEWMVDTQERPNSSAETYIEARPPGERDWSSWIRGLR